MFDQERANAVDLTFIFHESLRAQFIIRGSTRAGEQDLAWFKLHAFATEAAAAAASRTSSLEKRFPTETVSRGRESRRRLACGGIIRQYGTVI